MTTAIDQRLNELEIRMAHQDTTIAELNEVITAQWKKLDALERHIGRLGDELEAMETSETQIEKKPPHY